MAEAFPRAFALRLTEPEGRSCETEVERGGASDVARVAVVILPEAPNLSTLLVRTDYSSNEAWTAVLTAATALYQEEGYPRMGASLQPVESPELADLTPDDLVRLERAGYLSALAVADGRSMRDLTVLFIDLNEYNEQVGRTFRAIPEEVEPIVANLSIANMDFFEFADNVDADGIFRGFRDQ